MAGQSGLAFTSAPTEEHTCRQQSAHLSADVEIAKTAHIAVCAHFGASVVSRRPRREACAVNFGFVSSLIVIILAVLSVFIEVPIVSNYAFWFAVGAYILLAGTAFGD